MILDATCGAKYMYKGLNEAFTKDEIVYMDIRKGVFHYTGKDERHVHVNPDIQGDIKEIPFPDNHFNLILFDPPHDKYGAKSYMAVKYGSWSRWDLLAYMIKATPEFHRVIKPRGVLLVKCQNNDERDEIIETKLSPHFKLLLKIEAHRASNKGRGKYKTYWMVFVASEMS